MPDQIAAARIAADDAYQNLSEIIRDDEKLPMLDFGLLPKEQNENAIAVQAKLRGRGFKEEYILTAIVGLQLEQLGYEEKKVGEAILKLKIENRSITAENMLELIKLFGIQPSQDLKKRDITDKNVLIDIRAMACVDGNVAEINKFSEQEKLARDSFGLNCLDFAIGLNQRELVKELISSLELDRRLTCFILAFKNEWTTPLRSLICEMPEIATFSMDRMITMEQFGSKFLFNFAWLDDTASKRKDKRGSRQMRPWSPWKKHPLRLMARYEKRLLQHPLCLAFIQDRWSMAKWFYFATLLFYIFFQSMVTSYMMTTSPPWAVNMTDCTVENLQKSTCENVAMGFIWFCCLIGILLEGFQIWTTKWSYINAVNILDWFCYISAFIIALDLTDCQIRTAWQWQLGAITVLAIWINMLLMFRLLPTVGLYVTMFAQISRTFAKFFVIFFLFLLAFSFSFYILLQSRVVHSVAEVGSSVIATWVMMRGELGYADRYRKNDNVQLYPAAGYLIFIIFLVFGSIIIMNLLVGLAVGDVSALQEEAKQINLAVLIDYALHIEETLPPSWRKKFALKRSLEITSIRYKRDKIARWHWLCGMVGHILIDHQLDSEYIYRKSKQLKETQSADLKSEDIDEKIKNIEKMLEKLMRVAQVYSDS